MVNQNSLVANQEVARVGKVVFLCEEENDLYQLGQIIKVFAKCKSGNSIVLFVSSRVWFLREWLKQAVFVVNRHGYLETHKVAGATFTQSCRAVQIKTFCHHRSQGCLQELSDDASFCL